MKNLTSKLVIDIMRDYDYELSEIQAENIIDLVGDFSYNGRITLTEIELCTDYVVNEIN
jgi:hypothetical protein